MSRRFEGESIELVAVNPDGDLACDFTIANEKARSGLAESLERGILRPVRRIDGGIEAQFRHDAWDAVRRYVELESQCCSFLTLAASHDEDRVVLRVTGRPDAQPLIESIFRLDS
jgi:hypothetical protein